MITKIILENVSTETYLFLKWLKSNASGEKTNIILQGIHVKNNGTVFESTTGFQLVIATLDQPLHPDLTDGIWYPTTLTKKIVVLEQIIGTFPDTSVILTSYDKPIQDTQTFITVNPIFLSNAINGFDTVDINLVTNDRSIQIILHSNNMPSGTYAAIVMPRMSDNNFDTIQSNIKTVKEKL